MKVKPFIRNEFFYSFDDEKYNQNWLSIGMYITKLYNSKLGFYYVHITNLEEDNNWTSNYRWVFSLSIDF